MAALREESSRLPSDKIGGIGILTATGELPDPYLVSIAKKIENLKFNPKRSASRIGAFFFAPEPGYKLWLSNPKNRARFTVTAIRSSAVGVGIALVLSHNFGRPWAAGYIGIVCGFLSGAFAWNGLAFANWFTKHNDKILFLTGVDRETFAGELAIFSEQLAKFFYSEAAYTGVVALAMHSAGLPVDPITVMLLLVAKGTGSQGLAEIGAGILEKISRRDRRHMDPVEKARVQRRSHNTVFGVQVTASVIQVASMVIGLSGSGHAAWSAYGYEALTAFGVTVFSYAMYKHMQFAGERKAAISERKMGVAYLREYPNLSLINPLRYHSIYYLEWNPSEPAKLTFGERMQVISKAAVQKVEKAHQEVKALGCYLFNQKN